MAIWVSRLQSLRFTTIILGFSNLSVVVLGGFLVFSVFPGCDRKRVKIPIGVVSLAAAFKIFVMVQTGLAQKATALAILNCPDDKAVADSVIRLHRKMRYKIWLWCTRLAMVITLLQIVGAIYLLYNVATYNSLDGTSGQCPLGRATNGNISKQKLLILYAIIIWFVPVVQCLAGSDVLRWRSFYATQDDAWKSHYQEVFDHGIREALCCLGRIEYLSVSEVDEVYSVARLLGDLVAYRASGAGHLEFLAGLALLQRHNELPKSHERLAQAPRQLIQDAFTFHKFAEAAYTGPLLDFGRHAVFFSCAWLYRQRILTPWTRNRRPILTGDNWWRGHAAAFLNYVNLPPETLRKGRVCQKKCEAAYFIVVLHHLRSVVIAIRGTETLEDLITDGLGRECPLSEEDLDGLINSSHIQPNVKQWVESSFPHYGHSGIVEAARDLYMQIEGNPGDNVSNSSGFLSSLLGAGCECDGYNLRIVGHSLGGAVAALLGMRLYRRYPSIRVYAYGPLPCVNLVIAEACSEFVTSIVHNNEFSSRLSVGSVLRLRAAALMALSQDSGADTSLIFRLARRFLCASRYQRDGLEMKYPSNLHSTSTRVEDLNIQVHEGSVKLDQRYSPWNKYDTSSISDIDDENLENPFHDKAANLNPSYDPVSEFLETVHRSENGRPGGDPPQLFLPGLVIHMVPQQRNVSIPLWKSWRVEEGIQSYKAYIANWTSFKDIVVSPCMFLDHFPWRCHRAMQKVLEAQNVDALLEESHTV